MNRVSGRKGVSRDDPDDRAFRRRCRTADESDIAGWASPAAVCSLQAGAACSKHAMMTASSARQGKTMSKPASPRRGTQAAAQQRRYRQQQKALRKPTRDDVARVALHWIITKALRRNRESELEMWSETIVKRLVRQGFERDAARRRIDQLIARYEGGWAFQGKLHLRHDNDD
jgi:hypothetical protein